MVGHDFQECRNVSTTLLSSFQDEISEIELDPVVSLTLNRPVKHFSPSRTQKLRKRDGPEIFLFPGGKAVISRSVERSDTTGWDDRKDLESWKDSRKR